MYLLPSKLFCVTKLCYKYYDYITDSFTSIYAHNTLLKFSLPLNQMYRSGEWIEWSALMIKKCLDVWANSLKKYNKKHIENNEESTHVDIWGLKD